MSHLNQLIIKSGGTPVDIPNPGFSYHPNADMDYIDSLVFHIETDVSIPANSLAEWKDLSNRIVKDYKNNLHKPN